MRSLFRTILAGAGHRVIEAVSGAALSSLSKDDPKRQEQVAKLVQGVKTLYARGLDKQDELNADRVGIVYAARAGYEPLEAADYPVPEPPLQLPDFSRRDDAEPSPADDATVPGEGVIADLEILKKPLVGSGPCSELSELVVPRKV